MILQFNQPTVAALMCRRFVTAHHRTIASASALRCLAYAATNKDPKVGMVRPSLSAAVPTPTSRFFASAVPKEDPSQVFDQDPAIHKLRFKERLQKEREMALLGGGLKRISRQHERGSLTARERLDLLFDDGTFHELDQLKAHRCTEFGMEDKSFPGDGVVTGHGLVNGRYVYAFSQGELFLLR